MIQCKDLHTAPVAPIDVGTKCNDDSPRISKAKEKSNADMQYSAIDTFMVTLMKGNSEACEVVVDNPRSSFSSYRGKNLVFGRLNLLDGSRRWSSSSGSSFSSGDSADSEQWLASPDRPATAPSPLWKRRIEDIDFSPTYDQRRDAVVNGSSTSDGGILNRFHPHPPSRPCSTSCHTEESPELDYDTESIPSSSHLKSTATVDADKRKQKDCDLSSKLIDTIEKLSIQAALSLSRHAYNKTNVHRISKGTPVTTKTENCDLSTRLIDTLEKLSF